MGKMSRDKGARRERELVNRHKAMGVEAARVPLSGAVGGRFSGDVEIDLPGHMPRLLRAELKARAGGEGFRTLERWLGGNDALFLWRDRAEPMVVLPWSIWAELMERLKA